MSLVLNAVIPVFGLILLGFIAGKTSLFREGADRAVTSMVYYFALPILFFISCATEKPTQLWQPEFIGGMAIAMAATFCIVLVYAWFRYRDGLVLVSMRALAAGCPNGAFIGIPIIIVLLGEKGIFPAVWGSILTIIPVILGLLGVELGLAQQSRSGSLASTLGKVAWQIIKNPLLISAALGMLFSIMGWQIYQPVTRLCKDFGMISGPAALFAVGMTASHTKIKWSYLTTIFELSVFKLILQPAIALFVLLAMHTSMRFGVSAFVLCALPSAAFVFILAQEYGLYQEESAAIVVGSTVLSLLTLPVIFLLSAHFWPGLHA